MSSLKQNEYYALFNQQGVLRSPMLHKSKRMIKKIWAIIPDTIFVKVKKIKIEVIEDSPDLWSK